MTRTQEIVTRTDELFASIKPLADKQTAQSLVYAQYCLAELESMSYADIETLLMNEQNSENRCWSYFHETIDYLRDYIAQVEASFTFVEFYIR